MRFFLDNCISAGLAAGLHEFAAAQNHEVVHLTKHGRFSADAKDVDWLRTLGQEGDWIVISGDERISRSRAERAAWHESGLTVFFLAPPFPTMKFWTQVVQLCTWFPMIVECARKAPAGHGYLMLQNCKAPKLIYPDPKALTR